MLRLFLSLCHKKDAGKLQHPNTIRLYLNNYKPQTTNYKPLYATFALSTISIIEIAR